MALPAELVADIRVKFDRYSVDLADGRQINLSGFKYLLKSCPDTALRDVPEARVEELYLAAAGPGSTKRGRCVAAAPARRARAPAPAPSPLAPPPRVPCAASCASTPSWRCWAT